MAEKILLLIGSGKNVGAHTVQTFKNKGYRVAQTARSLKAEDSTDGILNIPCDLTKPDAAAEVFDKVRKEWGEPSVVIYNAGSWHVTKPEETFSNTTEDFVTDMTVNATSAFVALREAIASFQKLLSGQPYTFIYTGNMGNEGPIPGFLSLTASKTAGAHIVRMADELYSGKDMRFFYVDERHADGTFMMTDLGGQAHADFFLSLVERKAGEVPWQATFVKGKGFVEFPHKIIYPSS